MDPSSSSLHPSKTSSKWVDKFNSLSLFSPHLTFSLGEEKALEELSEVIGGILENSQRVTIGVGGGLAAVLKHYPKLGDRLRRTFTNIHIQLPHDTSENFVFPAEWFEEAFFPL